MFKVRANSLRKIISKMKRIMIMNLIIKNNKSLFLKDLMNILQAELDRKVLRNLELSNQDKKIKIKVKINIKGF